MARRVLLRHKKDRRSPGPVAAVFPFLPTESSPNPRRLFDSAPVPIFCKGTDNTFILVNAAAARLFGTTPEKMSGRLVRDFFSDDHEEFCQEDLVIIQTGQPRHKIVRQIRTSFAGLRWFSIDKNPIRQGDGRIIGVIAVYIDITELKKVQDSLAEASYKYDNLTSRIPGGVYTLRLWQDGKAKFEFVSDMLCMMLGIQKEDALRSADTVHDTIHPDDRASLERANAFAIKSLMPFHWEGRSQIQGETRWIRVQSNPLPLPDGESLWSGIVIDITDKILLEKKLKKRACTDDLTGLFNRRQFIEASSLLLQASKQGGTSFAVAMVDIDYFKGVNDTYGHAVGDMVLEEFSKAARANFRETDILGRLGGEEFGVVMSQTNHSEAVHILERFRMNIANMLVRVNDNSIAITMSCGLCTSLFSASTFGQLLNKADQALYQAKRLGRNRVVVFSDR